MNRSRNPAYGWASCALLGLMLVACDEPAATDPIEGAPETEIVAPQLNVAAMSVAPMSCPTTWPEVGHGLVTSRGGTIQVGQSRIDVPAGAVKAPTAITMIMHASPYMLIEMRANGRDHFQFEKPIEVTIDYSHCEAPTTMMSEAADRTAWYVDEGLGIPVEAMSTTDDPAEQRLNFTTDHFSVYIIAN